MRSGNVAGAFEGVRRQAVGVLDELISRAGEFDAADPPPTFGRYRKKLDRGHDIEGGSRIGPWRQKLPERERAGRESSRPRRDRKVGDRRRRT